MKTLRTIAQLLGCSAFLILAVPAQAAPYTAVDLGGLAQLGTPSGLGNRVVATGLNASGQVVGYHERLTYIGPGNILTEQLAFVTGANGAGMTALGTLGGANSWGYAINDAGEVAGLSDAAGSLNAFYRPASGGPLRDLGAVASPGSEIAINASGQVAGYGFVTAANGGTRQALPTLNGSMLNPRDITADGRLVGHTAEFQLYGQGFVTDAGGANPRLIYGGVPPYGEDNVETGAAINQSGQVTGSRNESFLGAEAFVWTEGSPPQSIDFTGVPGYAPGNLGGFGQYGPASHQQGLDINDAGQVVGVFTNGWAQTSYAFLTGLDGQGVVNVDSLVPLGTEADGRPIHFLAATGINELGQFIASATNGHSYLISPIPEPEVVLLMLLGLAVILPVAQRVRRAAVSA